MTNVNKGARESSAKAKNAFARARRPLLPGASDRRLVREMLPEIRRKRAAGWSYAELRQALAETFSFRGSRQTLAAYVSQLLRAEARAAGEAASANSPPAARAAVPAEPSATGPRGGEGSRER